jgi:hypothetical protein
MQQLTVNLNATARIVTKTTAREAKSLRNSFFPCIFRVKNLSKKFPVKKSIKI